MEGRIEEELRRFELLQHGLDHIGQGITVMDSGLRLVAWNRRFLTMLDFPEELAQVGTPLAAFIRYNALRGEYGAGDPEEKVRERIDAALTFRPHHFERTRPTTGQIISVRGEPLPGGGFVTVYTDITEQRYYEMMIRDRNEELDRRVRERTSALEAANAERDVIAQRLALITDTVPALIAYIDRDRRYRFANRGYAEWFGHTKDSIVGLTVAEVVEPKVHVSIFPKLEQALGGSQVSYEYSMQRNGRTVYARSTLVPERDGDGRVVGLFVLSVDVTEQKKAGAALIQAQKMEAVGQLTGGLAHDFNNLLTIVLGNLAALRDRLPDGPNARELLEPALAAARRGAELTRRLLAFSRRQPLEPVPVEVGRLVTGMLELLRRSLSEAIAIDTVFPEPLWALADAHQLENALLNLVLNARDAMPDGGTLEVATAARTVPAEDAGSAEVPSGDYVSITVKDSGAGMDEATLSRAFEPFFTSKEFGSGSGLGLAMVYGFVKQSGGCVRIHSKPGKGTSVTVLLPRAAEPAAPQPAGDAGPASSPPERGLVLLVEDDREVRKVIRRQLRDLGYVVLEAGDGVEAMRLIEGISDIAIVLTDMVMPGGMSGRALAEAARRARPGLKVVLMSGYSAETGEAGAPFLVKPFSPEQLSAAMRGGDR